MPLPKQGRPATSISIDDYVVDTLMRDLVGHDRRPSAFLVYLYLWRAAQRNGDDRIQVSLLDIAQDVGLSKRAVQNAIGWLVKRKLIRVARESITAVPVYCLLRPWRR